MTRARVYSFAALLLALVALGTPASAQTPRPAFATLQSAAVANGNGTALSVLGQSATVLTVNCASCSGGTTVNFEGSEDNTNWASLNAVQLGTSTITTATTTAGVTVWEIPIGALQFVRARISAYSAGTVTATAHASPNTWSPRVVNANIGVPGTRIRCVVAVSTATTVQAVGNSCVAPGAGLSIYVTDVSFGSSAASGTAADSFPTLKYGTGGTCGTGTAVTWQALSGANTTVVENFTNPIKIPANNELCWIMTTAGSKTLQVNGYIAP